MVEEGDLDGDTITILIATDNHLGYLEQDPVRGKDSIDSFHEILKLAAANNVDFILLGGDLFHHNKPSRSTLYQTMALLRKYCWGDRPCHLKFLSDQTLNFQDPFGTVNYLDPNINVGLPVFSIHGNHDDPTGDGKYCALDLLSAAGLVNYFGKCADVDNITLSPILLEKGKTRLALYGMGNVRDERLNRTFRRRNVEIMRPSEEDGKWFNLLVLHQNRVAHGPKNYIPETFLDDFLNFILWGHEHECRIDPQKNPQQGFYVSQPGSSIATSLSDGESKEKHVGILRIKGTKYSLEKLRLKTVRPFIMGETVLSDELSENKTSEDDVVKHLAIKVQVMIDQANRNWKELNPTLENFPLPLIRLKVEYTGGYQTVNPIRFGSNFVSKVANPKDIVLFFRKHSKKTTNFDEPQMQDIQVNIPDKLENFRVEDLVEEYLATQTLSILPENQLSEAVKIFVDKEDKEAIKQFVSDSVDRTRNLLTELDINDDRDEIKKSAGVVKLKLVRDFTSAGKPLTLNTKKGKKDDDPKGRKPAAKKTAAKKPAATGRGKKKVVVEEEDEDDDEIEDLSIMESEEEEVVVKKTATKSRTKPVATKSRTKPVAPKKGKKAAVESDVDIIVESDEEVVAKPVTKKALGPTSSKRKIPKF